MFKKTKSIILIKLCVIIILILNITATFCASLDIIQNDESKYQVPIPKMDMITLNWYEATFAVYKKSVGYRDHSVYLEEYNARNAFVKDDQVELMDSIVKGTLKRQWSVSDKKSALEVLKQLRENGVKNKSAWDLSRAMSNVYLYYRAGYLEFDSAMDYSYSIANEIKKTFSTWEDFNISYLEGYAKWSGSKDRKFVYDQMILDDNNVFAKNKWNTSLVKYGDSRKDDGEKIEESKDDKKLYELGRKCELGEGTSFNYFTAKKYYDKAATLGNDNAMYCLGYFYSYGLGTKQDLKMAKKYYDMAAEKNNKYALHNLAIMYRDGFGVDKDYKKTEEYFKKAGEAGNGYSYACLGEMYENGIGLDCNTQNAKDCYEKGIALGSSDAMLNLGIMYCTGTYTNVPNLTQGKEYLEKAAEMGNQKAVNMLDKLNLIDFGSLENDNK